MRRAPAVLALALAALVAAPAAFGATGSLNDPDDDGLADVLRLSYANKQTKVVMRMSYDAYRPQVENFYVRWGTSGEYYKLQHSLNGTSLWYSDGSEESEKTCADARVGHDAETFVTTGTIPRSCMLQAPGKVKFRGIVTEGLAMSDATRTSSRVARG